MLLGCGSSADDAATGGSGGSGGGAGAPAGPNALSFSSETFKLVPGEARAITVKATPPGVYRVRLALLGDARDASLDSSEVDTNEEGEASVQLVAPTEATAFTLRASSGSIVAQAGVSVSVGFATLQVKPKYSGKRNVTYWVASVRTGITCAELTGKPVDDGDLKGTAPFEQVPQVSDVPVGPALAVTLRGAWSIAGCTDVVEVRAGEINEVSVQLTDLPMKLSETDLAIAFSIDQAAPMEWSTALDSAANLASSGVLDGQNDDVSALLDAMAAETANATDAAAFASAESSESWHALVTTALGGTAAKTALRAPILGWMAAGTAALSEPDVLSGRLRDAGKYPGKALIELESVAGFEPEHAGFVIVNNYPTAVWTAEPGDIVLLGATFQFAPSKLLAALAEGPALASVPGATSVPEALSAQIGCDTIASVLVTAGGSPTEAFPGCDVSCMQSLCDAALVTLWTRVRDVSLTTPAAGALNVTATGQAGVDDLARPTGFTGDWVGSLDVGATIVPVSGTVHAETTPPPS